MRKKLLSIVALLLMTVTCAVAQNTPQNTHTVTLKEGTADSTSWQGKAGEGNYQTLPLTGVEAGTAVTVKYNGTKKVKSVKAVKKAPAYAANEYNEGAWDGTKVVFTKQTAASVTAVTDATANVIWDAGWYTVSGNVTITGNVTLGADMHLILQDGAQLTINGQLNCNSDDGYNLYIYGQEAGDGKLNVSYSDIAISGSPDGSGKTIEIHGGEITATSTSSVGFFNDGIKMYGGKLTATGNGTFLAGIAFTRGNFDVYGGEVEAINTGTDIALGIMGGDGGDILTVYGGTVKATGGTGDFSLAIYADVKSGTPGIKFYFADTEGAWGDGASYSTATPAFSTAPGAHNYRYAKAEAAE